MAHPIKYFTSGMTGAPQITNAFGCITAVLDAVLVNGFNLKTVNSITNTGGVATATVNAGHGYAVGNVVLIAGADQAEYNGECKVLSSTTSTFTFAITGTPAAATGTITSTIAPLDWEIQFTGTQKRAYRSKSPLSNKPVLRVDDSQDPVWTATYAKYAKVTMAQGMSDIDTFVGTQAPYEPNFPLRNHVGTGSGNTAYNGWFKWYYATATSYDTVTPVEMTRSWVLVGDDRAFYLFTQTNNSAYKAGYCFGDFPSYRASDGFNSMLCATDLWGTASSITAGSYGNNNWLLRNANNYGKLILKDYTQIGGAMGFRPTSLNPSSNTHDVYSGYNMGLPWPNGPDYSLVLSPVHIVQNNDHIRGKFPGFMYVLNNNPLNDLAVVSNVNGYPGRDFLLVDALSLNNTYRGVAAFDITGPWW